VKSSNLIKIIASLCFILLAVALVAIRNSPATGYESSIYWSTPPLVWGFLFLSIACGIGIIVYEAYRNEERSKLWVTGFILILSSNTIILSLHILRGYAMLGASGDAGTHLGTIQDIIATGNFARSELFYPVTHIYLSQLSQITNVGPVTLMKWVPALFPLLYMVFMYLLAKALLHGKRQVLLATVAATAPTIGISLLLLPYSLSNMFFPVVLFLLIKSLRPGTWRWRTAFIFILFLFPVFHELPTIALIAMLINVPLALFLSGKLAKDRGGFFESDVKFCAIALLILLAWATIWLFPAGRGELKSLVPEEYTFPTEGIVIPSQLPAGASHYTKMVAEIRYAEYYGYNIAEYFFKEYGDLLVYILLALIAAPILWRGIRDQKYRNLTALYGPLVAVAILIVGLFFTSLPFGPLRFLTYAVIICTIFTGFTLSKPIDWTDFHASWVARIAACAIAALLVVISTNAIFTIYTSPYINSPSYHNTEAEIDGMDWFLHKKDTEIYSAGWYYAPWRYAAYLLTEEELDQRYDYRANVTEQISFHLGYDEHSMMGQAYEEDIYVVFRELNRLVYVDVFPKMAEHRLLPEDFKNLDDDISLDKLYDNSDLDIWYAHATE